eukprot:TRINITY_DN111105_c0_g1_i1.p1 TRINITY_DN111105_c0_g1~~TRINITY_DN111105_c0_g1_i1.p1  ORF type:complete len:234 (-),score=28.35 TRINITY_DN111105_c0_g1_i1:397-1098(-)
MGSPRRLKGADAVAGQAAAFGGDFTLSLEKSDASETLGITTVGYDNHTAVLVRALNDTGLVPRYNNRADAGADAKLLPGDVLVAVNTTSGDYDAMMKELCGQPQLELTVKRTGSARPAQPALAAQPQIPGQSVKPHSCNAPLSANGLKAVHYQETAGSTVAKATNGTNSAPSASKEPIPTAVTCGEPPPELPDFIFTEEEAASPGSPLEPQLIPEGLPQRETSRGDRCNCSCY